MIKYCELFPITNFQQHRLRVAKFFGKSAGNIVKVKM